MDEDVVERVLRIVDAIPSGRICSYGDIAELLEIGPRQVGAVMSRHGALVSWWRVTNASGELPEHLLDEARARWMDEGIAISPSGRGARIRVHRADLDQLADATRATMEP